MFGVIIGFDIKDFSQTARTDEMIEQRNLLCTIINESTTNIKVFSRKKILDIGDGCFILIDTGDYEKILQGLVSIQKKADEIKKVKFRGIVHIGKFSKTPNILDESHHQDNYVGNGINDAARCLNASCLKQLLAENSIYFTYGISSEFYKQVYDQPYFVESDFSKYSFQEKKYSNLIFLNNYAIKKFPATEKILSNTSFRLKPEYINFLKKSEFVYQYQENTSDLDTFYVFPELTTDKPEESASYKACSEKLLLSYLKCPSNLLIAGSDQSGKTSLCKKYYKAIYDTEEYIPVYIKLSLNEKGNIENKINDNFSKQYGKHDKNEHHNKIKILLIDDFHLINDVNQDGYIDYILQEKNMFAILFVDAFFLGSIKKQKMTRLFKAYTIREFGHQLRNKLIEKWANFVQLLDHNYGVTDELSEYIDNTFIKGIIPFTPFYILTVLAARADFVPLNGDLTSKGHCYQALIYISLRKVDIPENEIGVFLNILTNIAYSFFVKNISSFNEDDLNVFLDQYEEKYIIPFERNYFIRKITKSSIFNRNSINQYAFYASYFYHYFVAKYIADHMNKKEVQNYIAMIYNNLDVRSNAYIGIFIVHHSKDIKLIEEVLINTMILYDNITEINLSKEEMKHLDDYANRISTEVIEEYDRSDEEREKLLESRDEEKEDDDELVETEEIRKEVIRLRKAMRTVEVMGHILKNHSGEIERKHLKECFLNALNVYRRICKWFLVEFEKTENVFIDFVIDRIGKNNENLLTREEILNCVQGFFIFFNLSAIRATILGSANALGSKGMIKIIQEISLELDNPFAYCVYLQCKMWYEKDLPIEEARRKYLVFPASIQHVMQKLIKDYTDLHHITQKEKAQIASVFDMSVKALNYDYEK
jgi:hypothetical protein